MEAVLSGYLVCYLGMGNTLCVAHRCTTERQAWEYIKAHDDTRNNYIILHVLRVELT